MAAFGCSPRPWSGGGAGGVHYPPFLLRACAGDSDEPARDPRLAGVRSRPKMSIFDTGGGLILSAESWQRWSVWARGYAGERLRAALTLHRRVRGRPAAMGAGRPFSRKLVRSGHWDRRGPSVADHRHGRRGGQLLAALLQPDELLDEGEGGDGSAARNPGDPVKVCFVGHFEPPVVVGA